jgi:hypothetical protein
MFPMIQTGLLVPALLLSGFNVCRKRSPVLTWRSANTAHSDCKCRATPRSTPWRGIPVTLVIPCFGTIGEDALHNSYRHQTDVYSMASGLAAELSIASWGESMCRTNSLEWGMQDLINPETLSHCRRRIHAGSGQALEVVLAHRLHLGWCGSNAAKLRADAKAGGSLAEE